MQTLAPLRRSFSAGFGVVTAIVLLLWFAPLGSRHLLHADEGRYAEIARELLATGDWVTIRYNGLLYFEKPPLHLWMTALAYRAFGVGDWQARLWVALNGLFGIAAVGATAWRWWGARAGASAALVLLAAPMWLLGGHFNSLDMSLSGALTGVLAAVLWAQSPGMTPKRSRRAMWAAWLGIAAAVLTKGPVGLVLPGLALIVYTLAARDFGLWRRLHIASGAALMLAVTAPWFVLISWRNPAFAHFFFIHEHWDRYTSTVHHRSGPIWYFVPQLLLGFVPWLGLLPRMSMLAWRSAAGTPPAERAGNGFRPAVWLAAWVVAIFGFFSLSGSKLPGYILPIYPALAMLAGLALDRLPLPTWRRHLVAAAGFFGAAAIAGAAYGAGWIGPAAAQPGLRTFALWAAAGLTVMAVGASAARWTARADRSIASVLVYALGIAAGATLGLQGHEAIGGPASGAALVPSMQAVMTPTMPIYAVRTLDHTVPWYLRRTTIPVEEPDELAFGTEQEPSKWLPTLARFDVTWRTGPPALALMSPETCHLLHQRGLPMWLVAADERRTVVANVPIGTASGTVQRQSTVSPSAVCP